MNLNALGAYLKRVYSLPKYVDGLEFARCVLRGMDDL